MSFYLPIMINARRLHVCHLQERKDNDTARDYWSFIINTDKSETLLSIDSINPVLIASTGSADSQELNSKWTFVVRESEEQIRGYQTFRVALRQDAAVDNGQMTGLVVSGVMGYDENPMSLTADTTILDGRPICIVLEYEFKGAIFEDSFVCYFCRGNEEASVAVDFGSEASQVRFAKVDGNLPLVGTFESMLGLPTSDARREYWQGKPGDELFKSVFWIRRNPVKTCFGDVPMNIAEKPFVAPLISTKENPSVYQEMELLPNLKLVELSQGGGAIVFGRNVFSFPEGSDIEYTFPTLADHQMRSSVLRVILNNFLHAILNMINQGQSDRYLRLVIMAPNVYYQTKVFEMMKGLYMDFDTIRKDGKYKRCKGLEVQIVSESDAAFIGARSSMRNRVKDVADGYFLNIDSGKGTTDFSIVQQQPSYSKFNSLYRDGIPAAGNVITYAYYEALYDFMKAYGLDIQPWIADAPKADLISFMSYLEELKKQPVPAVPVYFDKPVASTMSSLQGLNRFLSRNLGRLIPGVEKYVSRKIDTLVDCLMTSIGYYMDVNKCVFSQVILSGRAFLCQPFAECLIAKLFENGWIKSKDDVIWVQDNRAKTCCLAGALAIESEFNVNYNSGLIGSPLLYKTANGSDTFLSSVMNKLGGMKKYTKIDMEFFYEGSRSIYARNVTLRLGGRYHTINSNEKADKKVYFLGDSFASQTNDGKLEIIDASDLSFDNPIFTELVNESLFPYYPGSAASPADRYFDVGNESFILANTGSGTATGAAATAINKNQSSSNEDDGLGEVL